MHLVRGWLVGLAAYISGADQSKERAIEMDRMEIQQQKKKCRQSTETEEGAVNVREEGEVL